MNRIVTYSFFLLAIFAKTVPAQVTEISSLYRVVAKSTDGIESISNTVEIHQPLNVYIPNAFTPNGDGLNDTFKPVSKGNISFGLAIYNRWGELIYESSNGQQGWDGMYMGKVVPQGIYTYKLSMQVSNGNVDEVAGTFTVKL